MRLIIVAFASLALVPTVRADALDDEIAREVCGSAPSADGAVVPNCSLSEGARRAFAGAHAGDDELPPTRPRASESAAEERPAVLGPDFESVLRWQASLGVQVGNMRVDGDPLDYFVGVTGAGGVQLDRLVVRGELTLSGVEYHGSTGLSRGGLPPYGDTDGFMQRIGIAARYAFAKGATAPELGATRSIGELWIEAGAGEERIAWDRGGVLVRPDLVLGIGTTGALRGATRRYGLSGSFRIYFARRTDLDTTPTCSAPCTEATPPAAWSDRAFMFDLDYTFGN
jgi:hypothetical protein